MIRIAKWELIVACFLSFIAGICFSVYVIH
jgi:hypothetical protein